MKIHVERTGQGARKRRRSGIKMDTMAAQANVHSTTSRTDPLSTIIIDNYCLIPKARRT